MRKFLRQRRSLAERSRRSHTAASASAVREAVFRRSLRRGDDELLRLRPFLEQQARIRDGWTMLRSEPYAAIGCPIRLVLATRDAGPIHARLRRLAQRQQLPVTFSDSSHDIQIERPELVTRVVCELGRRS